MKKKKITPKKNKIKCREVTPELFLKQVICKSVRVREHSPISASACKEGR
jgi:hypothetical protein